MFFLKKESLRLISNRCNSMALNKMLYSMSSLGYSSLSCEPNDWQRFSQRVLIDWSSGFSFNSKCRLSLRGCLDSRDKIFGSQADGSGKANIIPLNHHSVREPSTLIQRDVGLEMVNGSGSCKHGRPLGYPNRQMHEKMIVAVDVDEVLGSFLSALNKFIADHYSSEHSVSEYYVYEFFRIWNCSRAEADTRVHEFFKTPYFTRGIHPIPGARHVLHKLSTFCNLSIVTSRQNVIKDHTLEWIEKHYPGLFQEIHFGNHFALDGQSKPKSEICRSLRAKVLIDDNPRYAIECAEVGIHVLLFDYDDSYPWSKCDVAASHPLVTKVKNWEEVEQHLVTLAVP